MSRKNKLTAEEKKLMLRYLVWCYKTTKEQLDRIDRYFTQLKVDENIINLLFKDRSIKDKKKGRVYLEKIDEFARYMEEKEARAIPQKYLDPEKKILQPDYWYLKNRLKAIEKTIADFLSAKELKKIQALYEEEMTRRILEAREHN